MPYNVDLSQAELLDQAGEVVGRDDRRVTRLTLVRVRVVVPGAERDRAVMLGERTEVMIPLGVIAAPAVDEDDGSALALLDVVQRDAVGDGHLLHVRRQFRLLRREDRWLRKGGRRDQQDDSQDS